MNGWILWFALFMWWIFITDGSYFGLADRFLHIHANQTLKRTSWIIPSVGFSVNSKFTMASHQQINVLFECCGLLRLIRLCTKSKLQIGQLKIPNVISYILLSIPLCFSIACDIMKVLEMEMSFQECANSFLFIPGTTQMQLIYICLAFNNELIIQTVDHIQELVDRSNSTINFISSEIIFKHFISK